MALTPSTMLPLGTEAPDFALADPTGAVVRLQDLAHAPVLVVAFICNHCPYVVHIKPELAALGNRVVAEGGAFVAINSNDAERYPSDGPLAMQADIARFGYGFPYLIDATQQVAQAYHAACTPDFFVFDGDRHLVYRGQFDDSRPGNGKPVTGADVAAAITAVQAGQAPNAAQVPSIGCNIKWKPGHAPGGRGLL